MNELLVMAGTIEDADALSKALNKLFVYGVMPLLVSAGTYFAYRPNKSWLAAGIGFLAGSACWYAVANAALFRDRVGEDLAPKAARPAYGQVLVLDRAPGPASGDGIEVRR